MSARRDRGRVGRAERVERRNGLLEHENEVLRRASVSVAGEPAGHMVYRLVRELAVDGIAVTARCRVLRLACQPYYRC